MVPCLGLCVGWSIPPQPLQCPRAAGVTSARRGTAFTLRRSSRGGSATAAHVSARLPAHPAAGQLLMCPQLSAHPCCHVSLLLHSPEHLRAGSVAGAEQCPPRLPQAGAASTTSAWWRPTMRSMPWWPPRSPRAPAPPPWCCSTVCLPQDPCATHPITTLGPPGMCSVGDLSYRRRAAASPKLG